MTMTPFPSWADTRELWGAVVFDAPEITKFWSALLLRARQEANSLSFLVEIEPARASSLEAEAALVGRQKLASYATQ
jgi:hypothetical protein